MDLLQPGAVLSQMFQPESVDAVMLRWSAVIKQNGCVVFDAPLILNFLAIM